MTAKAVRSEFSELMLTLDYPMVIVTTAVDGERAGCLVGFSTQASIDPPRYLVGISVKNHTHRLIERADGVAVHFPDENNRDLVELFGGETGDEVDKFSRCEWIPSTSGVPLLEVIDRRFDGRVVSRFDLGDHTGVLIEPLAVDPAEPANESITFHDVKDLDPGHEP